MSKISSTINNAIYNFKRNKYINHVTSNLGKIYENENTLFCMVDNKKLSSLSTITLYDMSLLDKNIKKEFNLDKKVIYFFKDMDIKNNNLLITTTCNNLTIIMENCNIHYNLSINNDLGESVIKNSIIGFSSFLTVSSGNLVINNVDCKHFFNKISLLAKDKLIINKLNCNGINSKTSSVSLISDNKMSIKDSNIKCNILTIDANNAEISLDNRFVSRFAFLGDTTRNISIIDDSSNKTKNLKRERK